MRHADDAAAGFSEYFRALVAQHDGHGRDVMDRLVAARADGSLAEDELLATATTLVGAAYHNTRNHIATAIFTMLQHGDQLAALRADPSLARAANEEILRYEPPVQLTLPRVALVDTKIGEVELEAGEQVCAFLSGAARDPQRYERPDELDITRTDGGSLALAFGIHSCIGAAMARMEGEVALGSFVRRFARRRARRPRARARRARASVHTRLQAHPRRGARLTRGQRRPSAFSWFGRRRVGYSEAWVSSSPCLSCCCSSDSCSWCGVAPDIVARGQLTGGRLRVRSSVCGAVA